MIDEQDNPEPFSGARPYTCCHCGRSMRTRGSDGRCYECITPPPQRCERCHRVRLELGGDWQDHPGKLPGEVRVVCRTCSDLAKQRAEQAYWREVRQLEQRKARGFGAAPEGEDVFDGFRGGE